MAPPGDIMKEAIEVCFTFVLLPVLNVEQRGLYIFSPEGYGYTAYGSDNEIIDRCGHQTILFVEDGTENIVGSFVLLSSTYIFQVGGVRFNAWEQDDLDGLRTNHNNASSAMSSQKRKKKQLSGSLRTAGARLAMGGYEADGYRMYAKHDVSSAEGIEEIFAIATDNDVLEETVRSFAPDVVRELRQEYTNAALKLTGRTGMNTFYCSQYTSPMHPDEDGIWSLCCQLFKNTASPEEYGFAFAKWGFYIITEVNCIWFFHPKELHGTVLPRQSSIDNGAISRGTHTTVRARDLAKATQYETNRLTWNSRRAYWKMISQQK
uniref:Uncharacterized protein n=1 Tax=Mycena chlorophos TaxID=658473 RepID=A0ABQ0L6C4_MYCCL|nr:predicted protein [Mycena chlorophos]